jgi:fused signal recognition particle receptor
MPRVFNSLKNFTAGLSRTRDAVFGRIATLVGATEITDDTWDELEATLIQADVGIGVATTLLEKLKAHVQSTGLTKTGDLKAYLRQELIDLLQGPPMPPF